jgi:hypothetical protein
VIRNAVVGRVRPGVPAEQVEKALQELRVEGLEFTLLAGQDLGLRPGGASFALTVDLPDEETYRIYDADAEHNRIRAEYVAPIVESIERVQFRLPD